MVMMAQYKVFVYLIICHILGAAKKMKVAVKGGAAVDPESGWKHTQCLTLKTLRKLSSKCRSTM